ncbi:MAG TPA: CBS domain-containing protein [Candidatus Competibacteraceae bacterium]|nr:CBS domain-containing protein [Candidatus Competibacteraceae bacterium]
MRLKDILAHKGGATITVPAKASVAEAIRTMAEKRVGAVLITDAGDCPVGIFTERDVLRLYAGGDRDFEHITVESRMTCSVVVGNPETSVDEALALMTERRFRHLPVLHDGELLGIVSIGDLVKARLEETTAEAQSLRQYILS